MIPYVEVSRDDSSIQRLCSVPLAKVPTLLRGVRSSLDCPDDTAKAIRSVLHIKVLPHATLCGPDDDIVGCEPNEFSIEVNAAKYKFISPNTGQTVFGQGTRPVDLQIVLLHELGHWAGIQQHLATRGNIMSPYVSDSHCIDAAVVTALANATKSPAPFGAPQPLLYSRPQPKRTLAQSHAD